MTMMLVLRFAALAALLSSALALPRAAAAQTQHLDGALRHALLTGHFRTVRHVAEIPTAVMDAAGRARGPGGEEPALELADPGERFQSTDVIVTPALPGRRLIAAYASPAYWILQYEAGGIAHTFHVAVFRFDGKRARFAWHAQLRRKLASLDELRAALRDSKSAEIDDSETRFY